MAPPADSRAVDVCVQVEKCVDKVVDLAQGRGVDAWLQGRGRADSCSGASHLRGGGVGRVCNHGIGSYKQQAQEFSQQPRWPMKTCRAQCAHLQAALFVTSLPGGNSHALAPVEVPVAAIPNYPGVFQCKVKALRPLAGVCQTLCLKSFQDH